MKNTPTEPTVAEWLFQHGFGSRRDCQTLLRNEAVQWQNRILKADDTLPHEAIQSSQTWQIQGKEWPLALHPIVALHKPAGFECSLKPGRWPSVLNLLPPALRRRGMQCVGRLDQDTTGLLLLTDHGDLLHRLTSPKWHVPKVYQVDTSLPVTQSQCNQLLAGVRLIDEHQDVIAQAIEQTGPNRLLMTLTQGKYHQVKRMMAAVGNPLIKLHRVAIGQLTLPESLPSGHWMWLNDANLLWPQVQSQEPA